MYGRMRRSIELEQEPHVEIVNKFLKECNPYVPSEPLNLDLRKYLSYAKEHNIKDPSEIPEEIIQQFMIEKSQKKTKEANVDNFAEERESNNLSNEERRILDQGKMEAREEDTVIGIARAMRKQKMSIEDAMNYMDIPPISQPRFAALLRESQERGQQYMPD